MIKKIPLLLFASIMFVSASYAGIIVTPARSEVKIEKENTFKGKYTVKNDNDATINIAITTENWNNSPDNKGVAVSDWLEVQKKSILLAPMESADIEYTVSSKNYEGSLSAMVSFTYRSPNASNINLMTSVPVYMTIKGTEKIEYFIDTMTIYIPKKAENKVPVAYYLLKNEGNIPLRVTGELKITSGNGKKVVYQKRITEQSPVYAGAVRDFQENVVGSRLPKGKYILNISLNALDKSVEKSIQFRVNKYGDISL